MSSLEILREQTKGSSGLVTQSRDEHVILSESRDIIYVRKEITGALTWFVAPPPSPGDSCEMLHYYYYCCVPE